MEQRDLQSLVETISLRSFAKPFRHRATMNARLRTTGGRYLLRTHDLEFNPRVLEQHGLDELIGVIKHELCHYHLHLEGRGYQHKDADFKQLLKHTGGNRYVKDLRTSDEQRVTNIYACISCSQQYPRRRKMDTRKYVCGKCGGKLTLRIKKTMKNPYE